MKTILKPYLSLLVLFLGLATGTVAQKTKEIQLLVVSKYEGQPLADIKLDYTFGYDEHFITQSDERGVASISLPKKLKFLSLKAEDENGAYYGERVFYEKKELKKLTLIRVDMIALPEYGEEIAAFRLIDARVDEVLRASGADTTLYEFIDDACEHYVEAAFPGGAKGMQLWISENFQYPYEAIERNEQGKVYLRGIVEADGTLAHVVVERGASQSLNYEGLRLLYGMPKWQPATCGGKAVRSVIRLPINFTLN